MPKGEILTLDSNRVTQDTRIYSECQKNKIPCWVLNIENVIESDSGYYVCQTNSMQTKYIYEKVQRNLRQMPFSEQAFFEK